MSERHAETQRSITMIIAAPDGSDDRGTTIAVDIERWFAEGTGPGYRYKILDEISVAAQRLIRLAAGKLNR